MEEVKIGAENVKIAGASRWSKIPSVLGVLILGALGGACVPSGGAQAPSTPEARSKVIACYNDAYQKKTSSTPQLDDKERSAADELLARHDNRPDNTCSAVETALAGDLCGMPVSLSSVLACDRLKGQKRGEPQLDAASKAQLEQRIQMRERREAGGLGQGGY